MADKILMNKNTLAALKLELKEYHTALPVFEMKEQKLKEVVQTIENNIARLKQAIAKTNEETKVWVAVMAEETIDTVRNGKSRPYNHGKTGNRRGDH